MEKNKDEQKEYTKQLRCYGVVLLRMKDLKITFLLTQKKD